MKRYVPMLFASSSFVLAACGGGAGGGSVPTIGPSKAPPTITPTGTVAQGTLVDDPSGTPLAGVTVRIAPWTAYTTPGPSPTPFATSTTDPNGHFTVTAKSGTYMLVIGSDSSSDTARPTIHDKLVLNGQSALTAPTMPPFPGITPRPVELSGNYRLANIDQTTELPCLQEYDIQRTSHSLPLPVVDEWLTENVRMAVAQSQSPFIGQVFSSNPYGFLTTANMQVSGGSDCAGMIDFSFTPPNPYTHSKMALWFAAKYLPYQGQSYSAYGAAEFPYDPRWYVDPNAISWP